MWLHFWNFYWDSSSPRTFFNNFISNKAVMPLELRALSGVKVNESYKTENGGLREGKKWTGFKKTEWNSYIRSIAKDSGKMINDLFRSRKNWLILPDSIFTRKRSEENEMLLAYLNWSGAILTFQRWQNSKSFMLPWWWIIFISTSLKDETLLASDYFYLCLHGKCSHQLHTLASSVHIFTTLTHQTT